MHDLPGLMRLPRQRCQLPGWKAVVPAALTLPGLHRASTQPSAGPEKGGEGLQDFGLLCFSCLGFFFPELFCIALNICRIFFPLSLFHFTLGLVLLLTLARNIALSPKIQEETLELMNE